VSDEMSDAQASQLHMLQKVYELHFHATKQENGDTSDYFFGHKKQTREQKAFFEQQQQQLKGKKAMEMEGN